MANLKRLRDLNLSVGELPPGPTNTIVDVPGVRVGHCDVGGGPLGPGAPPIHTGVTVVVPGEGNLFAAPLPAAVDIFNGYGKSAGIVQIDELGCLESPIFLCATLNVGRVWDAACSILLEANPRAVTANPAVFECNDARFSDARARPVGEQHVRAAYAAARGSRADPPALGSVGAGRGTLAFGFKGGIGSASRVVETADFGPVRLGVLSYNNFGGRLQWRGRLIEPPGGGSGTVPISAAVRRNGDCPPCSVQSQGRSPSSELPEKEDSPGSVIVLVATDAPLAPGPLRRIARRAWAGIARLGARFGHGSGDIAVAFALPNPEGGIPNRDLSRLGAPACPAALAWRLGDRDANRLFDAAAEATEESVWDAMLLAQDTVDRDGRLCPALRPEQLLRAAGETP